MSQKIRIMTYNVHSCIGTDRKTSTERIAEVIFHSGADIVALQEVDNGLARTGLVDQAREIAGTLEMHFHFHPSLHLEEGAYGNALLSRFPLRLVRGGALPTPRGLRRFERRGALKRNDQKVCRLTPSFSISPNPYDGMDGIRLFPAWFETSANPLIRPVGVG